MLAYVLALMVGLGSLALYLAAFVFPAVHRKNDFIWSGVGLFYALVLWVCAGRITGGVLLGQTASVALLGWLGWQTFQFRRQATLPEQPAPAPDLPDLQAKITTLLDSSTLAKLSAQINPVINTVKGWIQAPQGNAESSVVNESLPPTQVLERTKPGSAEPALTKATQFFKSLTSQIQARLIALTQKQEAPKKESKPVYVRKQFRPPEAETTMESSAETVVEAKVAEVPPVSEVSPVSVTSETAEADAPEALTAEVSSGTQQVEAQTEVTESQTLKVASEAAQAVSTEAEVTEAPHVEAENTAEAVESSASPETAAVPPEPTPEDTETPVSKLAEDTSIAQPSEPEPIPSEPVVEAVAPEPITSETPSVPEVEQPVTSSAQPSAEELIEGAIAHAQVRSVTVDASLNSETAANSSAADPREHYIFGRFTDQSRQVMLLAEEETHRLGRTQIGPEQILLGLIAEETGIAAQVLKSQGMNLEVARAKVEELVGRGPGGVSTEKPLTSKAKRVLDIALEESRQSEHHRVDTELLLLALIQAGDNLAVRVLDELGTKPQDVRDRILQIISEATDE
jgi:hypothetical protein